MTKYILHGGEISRPAIHNQKYFQEIVRGLKSPIRILLVYFAREKQRWQEFKGYDDKKFNTAVKGKMVKCVLADDDPVRLADQISRSDVIYIIGGSDKSLQKHFRKFKDLSKLFSGKVVAGSSAGANMLGRYYYDVENEKVENGLNVLPIKVISHYKGSKYAGNDQARVERLRNHGEDLKIYTLPETEYFVIEQSP